jgi:dTMP kinase
MENRGRGKLLVIEGMDGAGTTTQTKLLGDHLRALGFKVLTSREPTTGALGQEARRFLAMPIENNKNLLTALALCFAADRMEHIDKEILPGLGEYDFVILDRYVMSSFVYQGLHLDTSWVKEINRFHLPPDLTLVIDVETNNAIERLERRAGHKEFFETKEIQEKIRHRYRKLAEAGGGATVVIDAGGSIEEVFEEIMQVIRCKFPHEKFHVKH